MVPDVVEVNPDSWDWDLDRPSISNWMEALLGQWGADDRSIAELLELSQHSIHGYEEANSLIFKLVKKHADGIIVRHYSACIETSVINAWVKLRTLGYRFK